MTPAEEKLVMAKVQLILNEPFFATLALKLEYIEDNSIKTLSVDGQRLKYNSAYILELPLDQVKGVLAHEVMHTALFHHTRRGGRDIKKWNKACVTGDSLIMMTDGSEKRIDQINAGDEIIGEVNGMLRKSIVLETIRKYSKLVEISIDNGYKLTCTPEHRILTESGYTEAKNCKEKESFAQVVRRGETVCNEEFYLYDYFRYVKETWSQLQTSRQLPSEEQSLFSKKNNKKTKSSRNQRFNRSRISLYSRYNRRRRNNIITEFKKTVLPTIYRNKYNFYKTCSLVRKSEILWNIRQKLSRKFVLEDRNKWLSDNRYSGKNSSLSNNKESSSRITDRIYQHQIESKAQRQSYKKNGRYIPKDKRIKCSRFEVIRRLEKESEVFDLTTTSHSYIANGIIVHNCDYAVNPLLIDCGFELPETRYLKDEFRDMPAEMIYNLLEDEPEDQNKPQGQDGDGDGSGQGQGEDDPDPSGCGGVEDSEAEGQAQIQEEENEVKESLSQAMNNAKKQGKLPAYLKRLIDEALKPKVDWQEVLARFLSEIVRDDYTFKKPNPRYIHTGFYLPYLQNETVGDIIMIVDTSGSINRELLNKFGAEMQEVVNTFGKGFTVVYVDTEVKDTEEVEPDGLVDLHPSGGGGTDFKPGFEWIDEKGIQPKAVVYFTDGICNSFPETPDYPVLWALYGKYEFDPPFGETVNIIE